MYDLYLSYWTWKAEFRGFDVFAFEGVISPAAECLPVVEAPSDASYAVATLMCRADGFSVWEAVYMLESTNAET